MDKSCSMSVKYSTCCLLGCKFVQGHDFIVITATDGHIGLLSIPDQLKNMPSPVSSNCETVDNSKLTWTFTSKFLVHQSSINCLEIISISGSQSFLHILITDTSVYLLTGGDDNAIHLSEVSFEGEGKCAFRPIASVLDAHTSTITGVLNLGGLKFLSIGIDQVVRVWKFDGENLISRYKGYTFVPDVGGIIEIGVQGGKRRFVIFGTGMEMISWSDSEEDTSHKV